MSAETQRFQAFPRAARQAAAVALKTAHKQTKTMGKET